MAAQSKQGNAAISGGAGPGGRFAALKDWFWVLGLLVLGTVGIMWALVAQWPRCDEQSCKSSETSTEAPTAAAAGAETPSTAASAAPELLAKPASAGGSAALPAAAAAAGSTAGGSPSSAAAEAAVPTKPEQELPEPFSLDKLTPTSGTLCGGTSVTISARGLHAGDKPVVRFGGLPATVQPTVDGKSFRATTPEHWEGAVDVTALTADRRSATLTNGFNFACASRTQERLLLLVVLAGALGGALHALRSLFYFIGNRNLRISWLPMYLVLPISGAAISTVFFLVFVGGLFDVQAGDNHNYYLMVGVSALVGMFSQQAVEKLKKISEAILTATQPSADADGETNVVLEDIVPAGGIVAGGEVVRIVGSGFDAASTVTFDGKVAAVQSVSNSEIRVTTPAHDVGKVDVEVTNQEGNKATRPAGFEYR